MGRYKPDFIVWDDIEVSICGVKVDGLKPVMIHHSGFNIPVKASTIAYNVPC